MRLSSSLYYPLAIFLAVSVLLGWQHQRSHATLIRIAATQQKLQTSWGTLCEAYAALHREQQRLVAVNEQTLSLHQQTIALNYNLVTLLDKHLVALSLQNQTRDP